MKFAFPISACTVSVIDSSSSINDLLCIKIGDTLGVSFRIFNGNVNLTLYLSTHSAGTPSNSPTIVKVPTPSTISLYVLSGSLFTHK